MSQQTCPTCGARVRVKGGTTKYYEPVVCEQSEAEIEALKHDNSNMTVRSKNGNLNQRHSGSSRSSEAFEAICRTSG